MENTYLSDFLWEKRSIFEVKKEKVEYIAVYKINRFIVYT